MRSELISGTYQFEYWLYCWLSTFWYFSVY